MAPICSDLVASFPISTVVLFVLILEGGCGSHLTAWRHHRWLRFSRVIEGKNGKPCSDQECADF